MNAFSFGECTITKVVVEGNCIDFFLEDVMYEDKYGQKLSVKFKSVSDFTVDDRHQSLEFEWVSNDAEAVVFRIDESRADLMILWHTYVPKKESVTRFYSLKFESVEVTKFDS